ncbi:MAG: YihY/virulence factor BrkB family protein [Victivallaceae bacterium]|nr:YihY/virulence factor BrkB family protein [Victivallaceae bacterium]
MIRKYIDFMFKDMWEYEKYDLNRVRYNWLSALRVAFMSINGFRKNSCRLRASALTFYSIFSLVPITAMAFGVAKGFGMDTTLREFLYEKFAENPEVLDRVFLYADSMLEQTKGGMIAGVGVVLLFWAVIKMLGNIEAAFNTIWGITNHRPLSRKFSDYLSMAVICPVLMISASSATTFVQSYLSRASEMMLPDFLHGPLIIFLAKLFPFVMLWVMFPFLYSFMPNTKVKFRSALIAGILVGTAFQLLQSGYLSTQIFLSKYNAIYGSFSALPLFLTWLQLSWMLILFGAEVSCAIQTVVDHEFEPLARELSPSARTRIMLVLASAIAKNFHKQEPALHDEQLSLATNIPFRLVRDSLNRLEDAKLIVCAQDSDGYYPALPPEKFTPLNVIQQLGDNGKNYIPRRKVPLYEETAEYLKKLHAEIGISVLNKPLHEL